MTAEHDPSEQSLPDFWEEQIQVAHTTVVDRDGEGWNSEYGDRWGIEAYLPGDPGEKHVVLATLTAFTLRAPVSLEEMTDAFEDLDVVGNYADAITRLDESVGTFTSLFEASADALECDDLLLIDEVSIAEPFRAHPDLLPVILLAVQKGPAGRDAAFLLADISKWQIALDDDQLDDIGLVRWAGSDVVGCVSGVVPESHLLAAEFIASQLDGGDDDLEVGGRADDLWLGDLIEKAQAAGALRVKFDLPPTLASEIWAGAPADIHDVEANPVTGSITIETHEDTFEVVGAPGTASQLVGDATEASPETQAWLRAVHERWWAHEEALHERVHEAIEEFTEGRLEEVPDETVPHLHMSDIDRGLAPWPLPGDVHLVPVESAEAADGHLVEHPGPLVFHAVRDEVGGVEGDEQEHEHIGFVRLYPNGHIQAWLLDDWMDWLPDHEEAVEHLLALGADLFIADVLHEELYSGVVDVLLTGDVRGH